MKHRLEVENFSGKSTEAVHQDFFAKLFTKNLTSILHFNLHKKINEKRNRKYNYKTNFTNALRKMKNTIILLFTKEESSYIISELLNLFLYEIEPERKGRSFERIKHKPKRYYMQYKPIT